MRFVHLIRQKLLTIYSTDPEVLRKGRIIQFLVLLLTFVSMGFLFFAVLNYFLAEPQTTNPFPAINPGFLLLFLVLGVSWWLARNGRIRESAHIFTAGTSLIFLTTFLISPDAATPYLMLIGVVAIAVLDSVKVSTIYALINTVIFVTLFSIYRQFGLLDITRYILITTGICITIWATAQELTQSVIASQKLNREIFNKNTLLQRNASLLQLSAEVAQLTGQSLNLEELLTNTVNLIRDRFGFYFVSIYLIEEEEDVILKAATGMEFASISKTAVSQLTDISPQIEEVVAEMQPKISTSSQAIGIHVETKTELTLPLIARGELRGVLNLHSRLDNVIHEQDIAILQIMANQVAVNIDNAILFSAAEDRFNQTKTLIDLNNHLTKTFDIGEIYRRASIEFATHLNADYCQISSWNKEENRLVSQIRVHQTADQSDFVSLEQVIDLKESAAEFKVLDTLESRMVDRNTPGHNPLLQEMEQYYQLDLPLIHGDEAVGLLTLLRANQDRPFTVTETQIAQAMANQTAIVLKNAILTSNTRGQLAQFSSLLRLSIILSEATSLDEVYKGSRRELLSLVEANGMSIMLITKDKRNLSWEYGYEFGQEVDLTNLPLISLSTGFSGFVATTREPLFIERTPENIKKFNSRTIGFDEGFWHGFPLIVSNKLIGVLAVESLTHLSKNEIELIKTIVGPLGVAINNLQQFEEIQTALIIQSRQRLQLKTAAQVAASATSIQSLDELLQATVDLIKSQFDLYYVGLFLVDNGRQKAILRAGTGVAGTIQIEAAHQLDIGGQSLIGGATQDGQPRIIQDVNQNIEWRKNKYLPKTASELALPLRVRGKTIGALTVQSQLTDVFDDALVETLLTMADQLAIAIENVQLLEQARSAASDQQWLHEVSTKLHQSTNVQNIAKIGLESLSKKFGDVPIHLKLGRSKQYFDEDEL